MFFLAFPDSNIIYYKLALFGALMVMAFFEAKFYINDGNLKNKKDFYKVAFVANSIVGLFLFLPIYWFDLLVLVLYAIRSIPVGKFFVKYNNKKHKNQAVSSYIWTLPKNVVVFIGYNFVFFLISLFLGVIYGIILNI